MTTIAPQMFFLSVFVNLFAGLALSFPILEERFRLAHVFQPEVFHSRRFRLILGGLAFVIGFAKLVVVTPPNPPVIGDLIPALVGMIMGLTLSAAAYCEENSAPPKAVATLDGLFGPHAAVIGIVGAVTALLHFLFPAIILL